MATVSLPALDWAAPIVDIRTGRPTPYLQRFWQNLKVTAVDGANQSGDIAQLQTDVTTINGQISTINGTLAGKANKLTTFAAPTGTVERTTFSTYTAPVAAVAYSQAQMQAVMDALEDTSRRLAAAIIDLKV